jgi:hypothetical protein
METQMPAFTFASMGAFCHVLPLAGSAAPRHSDAAKEGVPMADRKLTEAQRAYEAKRAAKAGMSLEKWLTEKEKRAAAEAKAAAEATKPPPEPKKPGFLGRLLEKAQKPL